MDAQTSISFFRIPETEHASGIEAIQNALDQEEFISTRNPIHRRLPFALLLLLLLPSPSLATGKTQSNNRWPGETVKQREKGEPPLGWRIVRPACGRRERWRRKKWKSEKERGEGEERRGEEEEKVGGMRLVKLSYFNKTCRAKREDNEKI